MTHGTLQKNLFVLFGAALAGFLDATVGGFIAVTIFSGSEKLSLYYLIGASLSLSPDFDFLYTIYLWLWGKGKKTHRSHRTFITHRPLVMLPIAFTVGFAFGGILWAIIAVACLIWHYAHDDGRLFFGAGTIEWFWPLSLLRNGVAVSTPEHLESAREWIPRVWLAPTKRSCGELFFGSCFFFATSYFLGVLLLGTFLLLSLWVFVAILWFLVNE